MRYPEGRIFSGFSRRPKRAYPDVLIGILSYNRWRSLDRLLHSLDKNFARPVNIVVSDDCSSDPDTIDYLKSINSCVMLNNTRLGVAGNSNRILKASNRFNHLFILNDDVEVINADFVDQFLDFKLPHICGSTPGIYGAKNLDKLMYVQEKMQGSVLYINTEAIESVGYFDESFGYYGMEHIDWSNRLVYKYKMHGTPTLQSEHIKTHPEKTEVERQSILLATAKELIKHKSVTRYVGSTLEIPQISIKASEKYRNAILAMDYPSIAFDDHKFAVEFINSCPCDDGFFRTDIKNTKLLAPTCSMQTVGGIISCNGVPHVKHVATYGDGSFTSHSESYFVS